MADYHSDTHPAFKQLQIELMRQTPAWRKLELLGQLNQTVKELAMSGLRQRYPEESEAKLRRRLADIILGPELAVKIYGALIDKD